VLISAPDTFPTKLKSFKNLELIRAPQQRARDATLGMPRLLIPSIQVNMRAGRLPPAADNGRHYLTVPINAL
jgi:hypothetical protein